MPSLTELWRIPTELRIAQGVLRGDQEAVPILWFTWRAAKRHGLRLAEVVADPVTVGRSSPAPYALKAFVRAASGDESAIRRFAAKYGNLGVARPVSRPSHRRSFGATGGMGEPIETWKDEAKAITGALSSEP
jgi:hypothetical protein